MSSGVPDAVDSEVRVIVGAHSGRSTDGLLSLIGAAGYRAVGAAVTPRELVDIAASLVSDVLVLDAVGWTSIDLLAFGEEIKIAAALPLVVVCDQLERAIVRQAKLFGIDAILVLPVTPEQLATCVEHVLGTSAGAVSTGRSGTYALGALEADGVLDLSAREREVFVLLARGYRPGEISRELFISEHTVRKHAKLIFRKLGVHSQVELMRRHFHRTEWLSGR